MPLLLHSPTPPLAMFYANKCFPGASEFIREMESSDPRLPTGTGLEGPLGKPTTHVGPQPALRAFGGAGEQGGGERVLSRVELLSLAQGCSFLLL